MKIALVHDYLNQYGGAERVLEVLSQIWPEAPIFTLVYDQAATRNAFGGKKINTSFLQRWPLIKKHHRSFLFLMPAAVEQFNLLDYDLVLSDSASYAKGVITKPETLHICYCHTPTRYLWDDCHKYVQEFDNIPLAKKIIPFFLTYLRLWDEAAASRVDKFIVNSRCVAGRLAKYYQYHDARVIYPPVKTDFFTPAKKSASGDYFLIATRLLSYKKVDLAIESFNHLKLPLIIVGDGREKNSLQKLAGANIKFVGSVSDEQLREYYRHCRAFIFPQEEDFGITAAEAMACGRPVIAYRAGGALETVQEEKTGLFFDEQNVESLIRAIEQFQNMTFNSKIIREHSLQFDEAIFKQQIKEFVEEEYGKHKLNHKFAIRNNT